MKNVPAYDAEIEYVEANNTAGFEYAPKIVFDYVPGTSGNLRLEVDLTVLNTKTLGHRLFIGQYSDTSGRNNYTSLSGKNSFNICWLNHVDVYPSNFYWGERNFVIIDGKTKKFYVNGLEQDLKSGNSLKPSIQGTPFRIHGTAINNTGLYRLYSLKLIEDDIVRLDVIPVRKGDKGYLYDKINHKLYSDSENRSEFILGPDIIK